METTTSLISLITFLVVLYEYDFYRRLFHVLPQEPLHNYFASLHFIVYLCYRHACEASKIYQTLNNLTV